jgi:uncharacterized protein with PIN domain
MMGKVSSQNPSRQDSLPARWWADEMLGRLARYLRMVGLDTAYVPGLTDDEVVRRAGAEGRTLLTRDRQLARRVPGAFLVTTVAIESQWRELRCRFPHLPSVPCFERCTLCNGPLAPWELEGSIGPASEVPTDVRGSGRALYRCTTCGHMFWDGTHVASLRRRLAAWSTDGGP